MSYDLEKDLGVIDDTFVLNSYWIMYVVSFKTQNTFSRNSKDYKATIPGNNVTGSNVDVTQAMDTNSLIITSDCISMATNTEKASHTSQLQATLLPTRDFLNKIFSGDWIICWMMHDQETFQSVLKRLRNEEPCNEFLDGLKFVGRVQSVREDVSIDPQTGRLTTRYPITATGFQELDSFFYYINQISIKYPNWAVFLADAKVIVDDIINKGNVSSDAIIPEMFQVLLGRGIHSDAAAPGNVQVGIGPTSSKGSPLAYLVPSSVGNILGRTSTGPLLSYADIMDMIIGIQSYSDGRDYRAFLPDGLTNARGVNRVGKPIVGQYNPDTPQFVNKTVWALLNQFLNNTINEMYTCLRVNAVGRIVPHIIVRQLPFSSLMRTKEDDNLTAMVELPRWKITNNLIHSYNLGRSDMLRTNFVHLTGQAPMTNTLQVDQLARNGVFMDQQDIKRNGLRMDVQTLSCAVQDLIDEGPTRWMKIRADIVMDQNLTLNGTFNCVGIQAPICEGDNIEYTGRYKGIYHIESVSHSCSIDSEGYKSFDTSLTVTHGVADITDASKDSDIFLAILPTTQTGNVSFEDVNRSPNVQVN